MNGASADSIVQDKNDADSTNAIAQDLLLGLAQLTSLQNDIFNEADSQNDYVTADLMTQLSKWAECNSWFLSSLIGSENATSV